MAVVIVLNLSLMAAGTQDVGHQVRMSNPRTLTKILTAQPLNLAQPTCILLCV